MYPIVYIKYTIIYILVQNGNALNIFFMNYDIILPSSILKSFEIVKCLGCFIEKNVFNFDWVLDIYVNLC